MADELVKKPQGTVVSKDPEYERWLASIDPDRRRRISSSHARMKNGLHAVAPLTCPGAQKCIFIAHCPIPIRNFEGDVDYGSPQDYPIGRSCVMERLYVEGKIGDYYTHLKVDTDNPIEVAIVNDLALIDLYKNRAMMILSNGDRNGDGQDFMKVDIIGFTDNGTALNSTTLHPAVEMLERLERRRERVIERLVETRKGKIDAQHKLGIGDESNKVLEELQQVRELLMQGAEDMKALPLYVDDDIEIK